MEENAFSDFALIAGELPVAAWRGRLADPDSGGLVEFEGRVRRLNLGKTVTFLTYEGYAPMADKVGEAVLREARERFGLRAALCLHRLGKVLPGEAAVWVGVLAGHRGEAFAGCRYIIDEVKKRLPVWKEEVYEGGESCFSPPCEHPPEGGGPA